MIAGLVSAALLVSTGFLAAGPLGLVIALAPALWLAHATRAQTHVALRNALHAIYYALLVGWVIPVALIHWGDGSVQAWTPWRNFVGQLFVVPGVLGFAAVGEFTRVGRGSVFPLDPTTRLVQTGPFAYVANPIQLAKTLTLVAWAVFARSWTVLAAALAFVVIAALVTEPLERWSLARRFGTAHARYRSAVRAWLPRWRPCVAPGQAPARLEIAAGCDPCRGLGVWLRRQAPRGLQVVEIADLPQMRYAGPGGTSEGILALCHALDHVHLGWAFLGWTLRLPLIRNVAQLVYAAA